MSWGSLVPTKLKKPWYLCRMMGCKKKTMSGVAEQEADKRFCHHHMPQRLTELRRNLFKVHRCKNLRGEVCAGFLGFLVQEGPVCSEPGPICSEPLPSPRRAMRYCSRYQLVRKPPREALPYVFVIKVGARYARLDPYERRWTLTVRRLATRATTKERALGYLMEIERQKRRRFNGARIIRFYPGRASRNKKLAPKIEVRCVGVFNHEVMGVLCESARKRRMIVDYSFEEGGIILRGKDADWVEAAASAVRHLITPPMVRALVKRRCCSLCGGSGHNRLTCPGRRRR